MDYLQEALRFLGQLSFHTGTVKLNAILDTGETVAAEVSFGLEQAVLKLEHSRLGHFQFMPVQTVWHRPADAPITDLGADNQVFLDSLRSGLTPRLDWLTQSLQYAESRQPKLREALKELRNLRNPWTFLVIPGASCFAGTFGPFALGNSVEFPRFTGHVSLRNVALNLPVSHVGFELSILGARAEDEGELLVHLGPKVLDGAQQLISPHLRLSEPEFDFKADAVLTLQPGTGLVQAVDVSIDDASFRANSANGLFHVDADDADVPFDTIDPLLAEFSNFRLSIKHLKSHGQGYLSGTDPAIEHHGGPVGLWATETLASKEGPLVISEDTVIRPLNNTTPIDIRMHDLAIELFYNTVENPTNSGTTLSELTWELAIPRLELEPAHLDVPEVTCDTLYGSFAVNGRFGPAHRDVDVETFRLESAKIAMTLGGGEEAEGNFSEISEDRLTLEEVVLDVDATSRNRQSPDPAVLDRHSTFRADQLEIKAPRATLDMRLPTVDQAVELLGNGGRFDVLDNEVALSAELAIAAVVQPVSASAPISRAVIVAYQLDQDLGLVLFQGTDKHLHLSLRQDDAGTPWKTFTSLEPIPEDGMHEVWAAYDGAKVRLFLDGADYGTFDHDRPIHLSSGKLEIGGSTGADTQSWHGYLREVRLWSKHQLPPFDAERQLEGLELRLPLMNRLIDRSANSRVVQGIGDYRFISLPLKFVFDAPVKVFCQDYVTHRSESAIGEERRATAKSLFGDFERFTLAQPAQVVKGAESIIVTGAYFDRLLRLGVPRAVVNTLKQEILDAGEPVDETFMLGADVVAGDVAAVTPGTGLISNDNLPIASVSNVGVIEGIHDHAVFKVSLSKSWSAQITFDLSLVDETATGGGVDYGSGGSDSLQVSTDGGASWVDSTTGNIDTGSLEFLVRTPVVADSATETPQSFLLKIDEVTTETTNKTATGTATIADDASLPIVSIDNAVAYEGVPMVFGVHLSAATAGDITLDLKTEGDTAEDGVDYENSNFEVSADGGTNWKLADGPKNTQITFAPGDVELLIRIQTFADTIESVEFANEQRFAGRLQELLSASEWDAHQRTLVEQALGKPVLVRNVHVEAEGLRLDASLLLKDKEKSQLYGDAFVATMRYGFEKIEGLDVPNAKRLVGVGPIDPAQLFEVSELSYRLPHGEARIGAAGFSQKFAEAEFELGGGLTLLIPRPTAPPSDALRVRLNAWSGFPGRDDAAVQVSVPTALLVIPSQDNVDLDNVSLDAYRRQYTPGLPGHLHTIEHQTLVRFGLSAELEEFEVVPTREIDVDGLGTAIDLLSKIVGFTQQIVPPSLQKRVLKAGKRLLDAIGRWTPLDFGLRIEVAPVTFQIEPALSDSSRIGVSIKFGLKKVRPYLKYKWFHFASGKWKESIKPTPRWFGFSFQLRFGARISFRFDNVKRQVEITNVEFFVLPASAPGWLDIALAEAQDMFFNLVGWGGFMKRLLRIFQDQLAIKLPESWDISMAKIGFKTKPPEILLRVEATQREWNEL